MVRARIFARLTEAKALERLFSMLHTMCFAAWEVGYTKSSLQYCNTFIDQRTLRCGFGFSEGLARSINTLGQHLLKRQTDCAMLFRGGLL